MTKQSQNHEEVAVRTILAWRSEDRGLYVFLHEPAGFPRLTQLEKLQQLDSSLFRVHPDFLHEMQKTRAPAILMTLTAGAALDGLAPEEGAWCQHFSDLLGRANLDGFQWSPFSPAARLFGSGEERRCLQMAVQFLARGGVEDELMALEYDQEFIQSLRRELDKS